MKYLPFALAPLALAISFVAHAADDEKPLNEIVVTASRSDARPTAQQTQTIDRAQIDRSTASTIADLLRQTPGLQVRQLFGIAGSEAVIDLGGFGASAGSNTLILIDGRRLNDIDLSAADIGGLSLDSVERIEILPASGGVLYGDGAVGGAINIVTRNTRSNATTIKVGAGSFDTRETRLLSNYSKGKVSSSFTLGSIDSDGYRTNNAVKRRDAGGKLAYTIDQNNELYLNLLTSKQDSRLPGVRRVTPSSNLLQDDPRGTGTPNDYANEKRAQGIVGWRRQVGSGATLIVEGGHRYKEQKAFFDDYAFGGLFASAIDTTLNTGSLTPRVELYRQLGNVASFTQGGIDLYRTQYDSNRSQTAGAAPIHQIDMQSRSNNIYLQQSFSAGRNKLTLGAREMRSNISASDNYDASAPGAFDSEAAPFKSQQRAGMYEAAFSREINDHVEAGVAFARSARIPTVDELYQYDPFFNRAFTPLNVQTGRNFSTYGRLKTELGELRASLFYNKLENEIHFNSASFSNENLDPTLHKGGNLSWRQSVGRSTTLQLQTSYQDAKFRAGPNQGKNIPLIARHTHGVTVDHQLTPTWLLSAASTYLGSRYFDNDQTNSFGQKIPDYIRTDLRARYTYKGWLLTAAINNVGDVRDSVDYAVRSTSAAGTYNAYPLPGRNFMISAGYTF